MQAPKHSQVRITIINCLQIIHFLKSPEENIYYIYLNLKSNIIIGAETRSKMSFKPTLYRITRGDLQPRQNEETTGEATVYKSQVFYIKPKEGRIIPETKLLEAETETWNPIYTINY